jgi:hypothetical protein
VFGLLVGGIAAVVALARVSWLLDAAGFLPKLSELLLEIGLVVIAGAVLKKVASIVSQERVDHEKRLEFLRRLRQAHVKIAHARTLIKVHDAGQTYVDQLANLMLVKPEVEEIEQDLAATEDLFGRSTQTIVDGIHRIVEYLGEGAKEYGNHYHHVVRDAKAGKRLADTITSQKDMKWGRELTTQEAFPVRYDHALAMSKEIMREHVFGPRLTLWDRLSRAARVPWSH